MNPKFLFIIIIASLIGIFISISSCDKGHAPDQDQEIPFKIPEAYPDFDGENVEFVINGDTIICERINGKYVWQGDIILTEYQLCPIDTLKGAGLPLSAQKWPNNTVYYIIDDEFPDQSKITAAIEQIQEKTNVFFIKCTNQSQTNFIKFVSDESSSYSYFGMIEGGQEIHLANADWVTVGVVIHEIGHALGLIHEHSRIDRNSYIDIKWFNIKPNIKNYFQFSIKKTQFMTTNLDTSSIMIYPSYNYLAIDLNKPTHTMKDGSPIANHNKLSAGDIEVLNMIYVEAQNVELPNVTTSEPSEITESSATVGGEVTNDGGANVTECGICWGTAANPEQSGTKLAIDIGLGSFSSNLSGLIANKTYFLKAYAINSVGTAYGNEINFTTLFEIVTDIDGNAYHPIQIGEQIWLKENLNVTHYNNGEQIPNVTDRTLWFNLSTGAYVNYNNDEFHSATYGRLYNFFAATDGRNICPVGWHVPTKDDWSILVTYLGGVSVAGGKMKATGTLEQGSGLWKSPNTSASNSSGFTALPGGYRNQFYDFAALGYLGIFWSSSEQSINFSGWQINLSYQMQNVIISSDSQQIGYSLRCLKN